MSDMYLQPTEDGGQLNVKSGKPEMTSGLDNAVYLSLFTGPWWGNAVSENDAEQYTSQLPDIVSNGILTNKVRLNIIETAKESLQWMIDEGIADSIEVDAEIATSGRVNIAVKVFEPEQVTPVQVSYGLNWDLQEVANRW